MANHIAIGKYLAEANRRGYLKSTSSDVCLADYINTANAILRLVEEAGESGLDTAQLQSRTKLAANTVRIYCRELHKLGKLSKQKEGTILTWKANLS